MAAGGHAGDVPLGAMPGMEHGAVLHAPQPPHPAAPPSLVDVAPERLIAALETKPPNVLIACMERLRSLLFKAEACQAHIMRGTAFESRQYQKRGESKADALPSTLIELPLPPSAAQTLKRGCSSMQRSVLPMRLSDQATALHMRLGQVCICRGCVYVCVCVCVCVRVCVCACVRAGTNVHQHLLLAASHCVRCLCVRCPCVRCPSVRCLYVRCPFVSDVVVPDARVSDARLCQMPVCVRCPCVRCIRVSKASDTKASDTRASLQLKSAVAEGRLDLKAFGVKCEQDTNPAHVAALLRVSLALMGKSQFQDPVEHWMLVPRQKLVTLYIDEYAATMGEIIRMANQAAEAADSDNPPPVAKYAKLEAQTYAAPTSRERIGDKLLQKLNCVVVPMVERSADPLGPGQVQQGVMSNPVGMSCRPEGGWERGGK